MDVNELRLSHLLSLGAKCCLLGWQRLEICDSIDSCFPTRELAIHAEQRVLVLEIWIVDEERLLVPPAVAVGPEKFERVCLPRTKLLDGAHEINLLAERRLVVDVEVDGVLELAGLLLCQTLVHAWVVSLHVDQVGGVEVFH